MNNYITIDGGTTNTRLSLIKDNNIIKTIRFSIGAKTSINGNSELKKAVKESIQKLLLEFGLTEKDITAVLASGMITSEYGLHEVKHIIAPAGIKELHNSMQKVVLNDISAIPFYFISGVIIRGDLPENTDMMRGEETEIMGLTDNYGFDYAYLLPGSHSKLITLDNLGRINSCKTMLTGEMISALSGNTILKGTVDLSTDSYDTEYLIRGYESCIKYGINETLFKTRVLKNIFGISVAESYSYFLGTVLANEIETVKKCGKNGVVIGGKGALKNPMAQLINNKTDLKVITIPDNITDNCTAKGAVKIFEY